MRRFFSRRFGVVAVMLAVFACSALMHDAHAAAPTIPGQVCSWDDQFSFSFEDTSIPGSGLISAVVDDLQEILYRMSLFFYANIVSNVTDSNLIPIILTIYVVIYGTFFMFGLVQFTVYDFFMRMVKIGLVIGMFSAGAFWMTVMDALNSFFTDGTDAIIARVTSVAISGTAAAYDPSHPFAFLDGLIAKLLSAKMAATLLATLFTGPYGFIFGLLLLLSAGSFVKALFTAMWVYLTSLVLRSLLLALTPLFIIFLLFDRTRNLFTGWVNQIVSSILQPILLFTFFAFFAGIISVTIDQIIGVPASSGGTEIGTPACWTEVPDLLRGGPTGTYWWRFAVRDTTTGHWKPHTGIWKWVGAETNPPDPAAAPFPIDIMHILIFLMLAELAGRFNGIIIMIARDLAGGGADLASMRGPLGDWFSPSKGSQENLVGNVGRRLGPTGAGYAGPEAASGREALDNLRQAQRTMGSGDYIRSVADSIGRRLGL